MKKRKSWLKWAKRNKYIMPEGFDVFAPTTPWCTPRSMILIDEHGVVNDKLFMQLSMDERLFVVQHEFAHHHERVRQMIAAAYNVAIDACIDDYLKSLGYNSGE